MVGLFSATAHLGLRLMTPLNSVESSSDEQQQETVSLSEQQQEIVRQTSQINASCQQITSTANNFYSQITSTALENGKSNNKGRTAKVNVKGNYNKNKGRTRLSQPLIVRFENNGP